MMKTKRPQLAEVPLSEVWPPRRGLAYITMSPGQWDGILQDAYTMGYVLIEVDAKERPRRAYRVHRRGIDT